jgi:large subunit ribosomal protein L19
LDCFSTFALQKFHKMDAIKFVNDDLVKRNDLPTFKGGDNITVTYKIIEGDKSRLQSFKGDVIQRRGSGATETFTVRKISDGIGVERIFPTHSPVIETIKVNKVGKVRRARIFYLRKLRGKAARIMEA